MKIKIFKPFLFLLISSGFIFSCNKKQVVSKSYEDIKWHSNAPSTLSVNASTENRIETTTIREAKVEEGISDNSTKEVSNNNFTELSVPMAGKTEGISKLSRQEKKQLRRDIRQDLEKSDTDMSTLLLVIIAIILPPIAVGLVRGWTSGAFFLNILLTLLFYVPGLIHALIVVLSRTNS